MPPIYQSAVLEVPSGVVVVDSAKRTTGAGEPLCTQAAVHSKRLFGFGVPLVEVKNRSPAESNAIDTIPPREAENGSTHSAVSLPVHFGVPLPGVLIAAYTPPLFGTFAIVPP